MEKITIRNHQELLARIHALKVEKIACEEELKVTIKQFVTSLNPLAMMKESLHELANDKDVRLDASKVGLNIITSFILDRLLGRQRSVKGFLSSLLIEKLATIFIAKNGAPIVEELRKWIRPTEISTNGVSTFKNK